MPVEVGNKFTRLTVLSLAMKATQDGRRRQFALCRCDCGNEKWILVYTLGRSTNSCGCLYREKAALMNFSHGCASTPEYRVWKGMLQRCYSKKSKSFKNYGGRGILVCDEWQNDFTKFLDHIGKRPTPKHTIERIDNDKSYEPGNVRWATRLEQGSNTRKNRFIEINGERKTLSQWSRDLKIPITTLWLKINKGDIQSLQQ